jgi:NAD(P)H-dependent FMN reductase
MRLMFFAGSTREGSYNQKLARLAHRIAEANGIEGVVIELKDYPMPLYNGDLDASEGPPKAAREFKALLREYQGVFIASPEYSASVTPLLKTRSTGFRACAIAPSLPTPRSKAGPSHSAPPPMAPPAACAA